jgi:hypothetical protein
MHGSGMILPPIGSENGRGDMEDEANATAEGLTEAELSGATIEALIVRFNTARRNSILAKARADYQNTNNNHREAVQYERLIAAAEKMPQAERKAIVDSNPDVLKGRQQAIVHAKEAALWAGEAEALRLYIMARSRIGEAGTAAGAEQGEDGAG